MICISITADIKKLLISFTPCLLLLPVTVASATSQVTYGKSSECLFLKSAICPILGVLTYYWIKLGLSIGKEKQNVSDLKIYNFDLFLSVRMRQRYDLFKRKWQAEALIYCTVLSL